MRFFNGKLIVATRLCWTLFDEKKNIRYRLSTLLFAIAFISVCLAWFFEHTYFQAEKRRLLVEFEKETDNKDRCDLLCHESTGSGDE